MFIIIIIIMNVGILIIIMTLLFVLFYNSDSSINQSVDESNVKKLVRQTARWATAADQDMNGYIANLHANYAMGYLMALREIYTDEQIEKYSGVNVRKLEFEISNIMDNAIKKLAEICPEGQPKNQYLATISKEGV